MEDRAVYSTGNQDELEEQDCYQTLMMIRLDYSPEVFAKAIKRLYKSICKDL